MSDSAEILLALAPAVVAAFAAGGLWRQARLSQKEADSLRRELVVSRAQASQARVAKAEFLANMSHELRTPLNAIIGMTDLLAESPLEPDQEKYLTISRRAARTVLNLINDLLDLNRIENGRINLESLDFDLHELLMRVSKAYIKRATEKKIQMQISIDPTTPKRVRGDAGRVRQILQHLLDNALKFTVEGRIDLVLTHGSKPGLVSLRVSDTGVGMSKAKLKRAFDEFSQADASLTRVHGGTGLGLAVCKHLAEAMRGTISAESREGRGTTFTVELSLSSPETSAVSSSEIKLRETAVGGPVDHLSERFGRILLVDDSADNQALIQAYLRSFRGRLDLASNGEEACEKFRHSRYDLVLMDIQMPVKDGYAATRDIRRMESESGRPKTPILALTAHALNEEVKKSFDAGCDAHLTKPVRKQQLLDTIGQFMKEYEECATNL